MKRGMLIIGLLVLVFSMSYVFSNGSRASAGEKKKLIRVGVYDSRAIPMAYTYSQYGEDFMPKLERQKKEAEAKGDVKKAQELEEQLQRHGLKKHKQVFSTTPVHDLLKLIEKKIPDVAKQAGVDLIVSKWQVDYLASDAETVDVTLEMAQAFEPGPDTIERIKGLMKTEPLTEEEVERAEKEHPH